MDALRGGVLAALIWEVGREILGVFLIGMRYTSAYGAIGSFIAILLWCYYAISILFFGAEYVQAIESRRQRQQALPRNDNHAIPESITTAQDPPNGEIPSDDLRVRPSKVKPRRSSADA
jgi:uncharacterized BrkB/YihY/UPF0761 family membrane protein